MKQTITIAHVESMGKSGDFVKIFGITNDPKRPLMAICIAHKGALPVLPGVGKDIQAVTYYGKSGLSFEPICDTIVEEGGVNEWVREQLS